MSKHDNRTITPTSNKPSLKISLLFDTIGCLTYLLPGIGEWFDLLWAPISAWLLIRFYSGRKGYYAGICSFIEEILPWTDFIPTFTICWIIDHFEHKQKISKETQPS